jgi:hypothetical protein
VNRGCSQTLRADVGARRIPIYLICILLALMIWQPGIYAVGPETAALGGTQVATFASGVPFNPAAVARVTTPTFELGADYPFGTGDVGYLALYEPKDPTGGKAVISGMLSVSQTRLDAGASNGVHISNAVNYQMADEVRLLGSFGVGIRYMRDKMTLSAKEANAWRIDVGWQGRVGNWLTLGVVGRDVLGADLKWSDASVTKRHGTLHAGIALNLGSVVTIAADCNHLNWQKPGETWSAGVALRPVKGLVLRGGYQKAQGVGTATAGAGVELGNFQLDLAATIESAPTGSLSITIEW